MDDLFVQSWEYFSEKHIQGNFVVSLDELNKVLECRTFLVGNSFSKADEAVYKRLKPKSEDIDFKYSNVIRYLELLKTFNIPECKESIKAIKIKKPEEKKPEKTDNSAGKFEEGGKYAPLVDAKMGEVVVRFPPEASGYLHVGHAKAAFINYHYRNEYKGRLIMRFDDTNPEKENEHFEKIILEDLKMLGIEYDIFSYTSDHFELLLSYCEELLGRGDAYVDNTEPEQMKAERLACVESVCRSHCVEENVRLWAAMKAGTEEGERCCVRIKMDMKSENGCMRDPTIYRCKRQPHIRTKDKYKVYPTYDFACPIVDSVEGVTHSMRSSEYNDRNSQFFQILDMLGLRRPLIADYSRLNLQNTVLSKRKLAWIVAGGFTDGWDDPRMPTVRGVLRHGMTVAGLQQFILAQGFGRSNVTMEWDKIWAFNKKVIDPIVPRYNAVKATGTVLVHVSGAKRDSMRVAKHPKTTELGDKDVHLSPRILVDRADADDFQEGSNVTFINWGNMFITDVERDDAGAISGVQARLNLEDRNFKDTLKVTWMPVAADSEADQLHVPVSAVFFGDLITKGILDKDDDFKKFVNTESKREEYWVGDRDLGSLKKGDIVQIQRKGFFICDEEYQKKHPDTDREYPLVLFNIPEGNKKERATAGKKEKVSDRDNNNKVSKTSEKKSEGTKKSRN